MIFQLAQYLPKYLVLFRGRFFHRVFLKGWNFCFCSFFSLKSVQTVFPFKPTFSKGPFFILLFVLNFVIVLKKWSYNMDHICQNTLLDLTKRYSMSAIVGNNRKNTPKSFLRYDSLYSQKNLISTTTQVLKKWSYNFHSECQNNFWTLISCPLMFLTLYNARKKGQNLLFTGKVVFFFKKFLFSATSYVLKKWSYNFHSLCQKTI